MFELKGTYNTAKVYAKTIEEGAIKQIVHLLNQPFMAGSQVCIMPDAHSGAGCTIGTTMTITDKVVPNLVGVDIGCGMETVILKDCSVELSRLDKVIHETIPAGFNIREKEHSFSDEIAYDKLKCKKHVNINRAKLSIGTLGGGNHFIELGKDSKGKLYLVVHSGSRHLGKQVAMYYQNEAAKALNTDEYSSIIAELKSSGREQEIESVLRAIKEKKVERNLAYCEGKTFDDYLHDMSIVQKYADLNRKAIVKEIIKKMKFKVEDSFDTIHNYIDLENMILRKGAISAKKGERVLIPLNMRDGSLVCIGKGNDDWNSSAPHGAGRLMSRRVAKDKISLSHFKSSMEGIYTTSVGKDTIDESPFAYKPMEEIISHIDETVTILERVIPIYNFKAGS